jgi:aminoglycoside phosphotransferase (APT) family kinase protein
VLRRQPGADSIFHAPDVVREGRVVAALAGTGVPVPAVVGWEPDPAVVGAPFFVMERVVGHVPSGRPSPHAAGWLTTLDAPSLARVWNTALDAVAALHALDWRRTHGFLAPDAAAGTVAAHVDRLVAWYRWTVADRPYPITDAAVARLAERVGDLDGGDPVIVWSDARVGNMLFADDGTLLAAIDWEVAEIGPAAVDVAHWLFFDAFYTEAQGITPLPGWPGRAEVVAGYEARTGRTLADLDVYELMDELFMATTLIRQADRRVAKGVAPAANTMGHHNTVTQMLARRLGMAVPELSPDYLAHRGEPAPAASPRPVVPRPAVGGAVAPDERRTR